jgi:hypothetical protein
MGDRIGMVETSALPPLLAARLAHVPPGALDFDPVPLRSRRDGWSAPLQRAFVLALAAGLGVSGAARAVGKSRPTAYRLRLAPGAASLAAAWDRAIAFARLRPAPQGTTALQRGVEGIMVPLRHRGRIIGWRRKYCGRSLAALLETQYRLRESEG